MGDIIANLVYRGVPFLVYSKVYHAERTYDLAKKRRNEINRDQTALIRLPSPILNTVRIHGTRHDILSDGHINFNAVFMGSPTSQRYLHRSHAHERESS